MVIIIAWISHLIMVSYGCSSFPDSQMCAHYEGSARWIVNPINSEVEQLCDSLIEKYNYYNPILRECKY